MPKVKTKQSIEEHIDGTNKISCNIRGCEKLADVIVKESAGKYGIIHLHMCRNCYNRFQKLVVSSIFQT